MHRIMILRMFVSLLIETLTKKIYRALVLHISVLFEYQILRAFFIYDRNYRNFQDEENA
jgi:hypothetical protein